MTTFRDLEFSIADGTATITLSRPDVMNACTPNLYSELRNAIRLANLREEVDVIDICDSGGSFRTGGDLKANSVVLPAHRICGLWSPVDCHERV